MTSNTRIGIDFAKNVFQDSWSFAFRRGQVSAEAVPAAFPRFVAGQGVSIAVMEACGTAHYWSRELTKLGHEVRLIAPQYVCPL